MTTFDPFTEAKQGWVGYTASFLFFVTSLTLYDYCVNKLNFFQRRNLKGPRPAPLIGNIHSIFLGDRHRLEREWPKQYGLVYGIFLGLRPTFVISDPEILRQICIKDFASMPDHGASDLRNRYQKDFIVFVQGEAWKRLRSIQSPTFTSGKIKRMYKLLDQCADDLVLNFSEQLDDGSKQVSEAQVDLQKIYSMYTMDGITTAGYTIKLDRKATNGSKSVRGSFVDLASKMFRMNLFRVVVGMLVPGSLLKMIGFKTTPEESFIEMDKRLRPLVEQRRTSAKKADDYLQLLVDARMDHKMELNEMDEKENHHAALTRDVLESDQKNLADELKRSFTEDHPADGTEVSKGKLTDEEIISNAVHLLAVGLDTTSILLTNCSYVLAFHPEVQQRLYEQIRLIAKADSQTGRYIFDYDELTSCEYLDAVISETLRLLAPVLQSDRGVKEDYYIEKYNVWLKKGDRVLLSYYSVMNNPEFWPEPLQFNPDRFLGENKKKIVPGSYCPFGLGPRHCLGMRFSLTEAKLALAKVLMKFEFTPAPGMKFPPRFKSGLGLQRMTTPFTLLTRRVESELN